MPKRFAPEVRQLAGELAYTGLDAAEIARRLQRGQAGLAYKVDISYRRVREYVAEYEAEHGPPPDPEDIDQSSDSIARLKRRITSVVASEIVRYESKRRPKLKASDVPALRQLFAALDDFERRTEQAEQRQTKRRSRSKGQSQPSKPESVLERMAREQREASSEGPLNPDPIPTPPTTDNRAAAASAFAKLADGDNGLIQGGEPSSGPITPGTTSSESQGVPGDDREQSGEERGDTEGNGGQSLPDTTASSGQPSTTSADGNSVAPSVA